MTFIADLSPCWYLDEDGSLGLVAIGWLGNSHPFTQGDVEPKLLRRLVELLQHPYCPTAFFGHHYCDLCTNSTMYQGPFRGQGVSNLVVPGRDRIFACPEMITHYISAHRYRPPDEFLDAVRRCPRVGTEDYFLAILRIGGSAWAAGLESECTWMANGRTPAADEPPHVRASQWIMEFRARNGLRAVRRWRESQHAEGWQLRLSSLFRR